MPSVLFRKRSSVRDFSLCRAHSHDHPQQGGNFYDFFSILFKFSFPRTLYGDVSPLSSLLLLRRVYALHNKYLRAGNSFTVRTFTILLVDFGWVLYDTSVASCGKRERWLAVLCVWWCQRTTNRKVWSFALRKRKLLHWIISSRLNTKHQQQQIVRNYEDKLHQFDETFFMIV